MPFEVMVVSIVAMCLGYSLLRHILRPRRNTGKGKRETKVIYENEGLQARADDLMNRLRNLEEIIASEKTTRS